MANNDNKNQRRRAGDFPLSTEQAFDLINRIAIFTKEIETLKNDMQVTHVTHVEVVTKMRSICDQVQEVKKIVATDHDLLIARKETIDGVAEMRKQISSIHSFQNRWKGAAALGMAVIALVGAIGGWIASVKYHL